jgi:PAS domain S-box-containing protein
MVGNPRGTGQLDRCSAPRAYVNIDVPPVLSSRDSVMTTHEDSERRRVEAALQRSEARGRALLSSLLDPTIVIDASGVIQEASASVERVFGYAPSELLGRNISVLMPEPHRSAHDGYLEHYRRTGETNILGRTREFEIVRKDGSMIVVELSVARTEVADDVPPLFIGSFRDVTDKKRAEQALRDSERRFRALFDRAFQFIGLLRPDGTVLEVNQAACEAGALRREDAIGRPFWEARWWSHSRAMSDRIRDAVRRAAEGEFVRFEVAQRGPGDSILDVDFSLTPVKDDAGKVVLLIPEGRDVTALKAAQRAETSTLRALATIGESAAVLAHEIKNPITAVHLALRAVAEKLGEDHRAVLEDLVARMRHLELLMRSTLSFARPLEIRLAACEARELLESAVGRMGPQLAKADSEARIAVDGAVTFMADPKLLGEVISNLVSNAIEAKRSGVHVLLSAARSGTDSVVLSVEDDGPGIPEERRESIFKPFVTTKSGGTGLGLAICRKIVEEHGGTIHAEPSASGARFVIRLKIPLRDG